MCPEPAAIDNTPTSRWSNRHQRAVALIAIAVIGVGVAGIAYLHPTFARLQTVAQSAPPLLASNYIISYDFVTPSLGWAAVSLAAPSSSGGLFAIYRTIDGAKHWRHQLEDMGQFSGYVPLSLRFFDKAHGYMSAGGWFYRSSDGGSQWSYVNLPANPQVESVTFSDVKHGWLLGSAVSIPAHAPNLFATSDAGQTWTRLPDPPGDAAHLSIALTGEAWLGSHGRGRPHMYISSDAGNSWRRLNLPLTNSELGEASAVYDVGDELLPGAGMVVSATCQCVQSGPFHFTSFDGGASWTEIQFPPGSVSYQDARHWWAINGSLLLKSSDAGETWIKVADTLPNWQMVPEVLDSKHAWAMMVVPDGSGLAFTADGGLHWTRAPIPVVAAV
jgi:photosystem II stability/assembly factor-like uncharacterized protein